MRRERNGNAMHFSQMLFLSPHRIVQQTLLEQEYAIQVQIKQLKPSHVQPAHFTPPNFLFAMRVEVYQITIARRDDQNHSEPYQTPTFVPYRTHTESSLARCLTYLQDWGIDLTQGWTMVDQPWETREEAEASEVEALGHAGL